MRSGAKNTLKKRGVKAPQKTARRAALQRLERVQREEGSQSWQGVQPDSEGVKPQVLPSYLPSYLPSILPSFLPSSAVDGRIDW